MVGSVIFSLVIVKQSELDTNNLKLFKSVRLMGSVGAGLAILSGIVMAYRYGIPLRGNYWFDTKLILVAADGIISQQIIKKRLDGALSQNSEGELRARLLPWAWLSVLIIIAVVAVSVFRAKTHS